MTIHVWCAEQRKNLETERDALQGPDAFITTYRNNVETTAADLTAKGVEFTAPIEDQGFGLLTRLRIPGAGEIGLYQPKHATAYDLE